MQNLKNTFAGFWKYRYLLQNLITRDFKLKYRRSVLGVLWSVLNPLLMMCVLAAVFTNVLKFGDVANFPMYLILGNVLFALMSDSTTGAMTSILESIHQVDLDDFMDVAHQKNSH